MFLGCLRAQNFTHTNVTHPHKHPLTPSQTPLTLTNTTHTSNTIHTLTNTHHHKHRPHKHKHHTLTNITHPHKHHSHIGTSCRCYSMRTTQDTCTIAGTTGGRHYRVKHVTKCFKSTLLDTPPPPPPPPSTCNKSTFGVKGEGGKRRRDVVNWHSGGRAHAGS